MLCVNIGYIGETYYYVCVCERTLYYITAAVYSSSRTGLLLYKGLRLFIQRENVNVLYRITSQRCARLSKAEMNSICWPQVRNEFCWIKISTIVYYLFECYKLMNMMNGRHLLLYYLSPVREKKTNQMSDSLTTLLLFLSFPRISSIYNQSRHCLSYLFENHFTFWVTLGRYL